MATIVGIVFTDLLKGICVGLAVAVVIILRNSYKNSHFLHRERMPSGSDKVKLTLAEEVVFLNKGRIKKELNELPQGTQVTIDMSKSLSVDHDVLELIDDFKNQAQTKNIQVTLIKENGKDSGKNKSHKNEVVHEAEFEQ
jgi:MFS superfamily sulfate permease-like transporter